MKGQGWDYGEGFIVGTPESPETVRYLWKQPVLPAKAICSDGTIDRDLLTIQEERCFEKPRTEARFTAPLILIGQTDDLPIAYWEQGIITYGQRILGIGGSVGNAEGHGIFHKRLFGAKSFIRSWLALTSADAGIKQATTLQKADIDAVPFPDSEEELDLSPNDKILLDDAFAFYRDYQRLGDDAEIMRATAPENLRDFAEIFTRQINAVHKKMRPLPTRVWAGVCCQPFVFGTAEPDWNDAQSLNDKLTKLLRTQKSATLTTVRILRIFDGPFVFLIKPDRLRYWLRSIALRDADDALADLRALGF